MDINYVHITEENREDFSSVLPEQLEMVNSRITIGAYDNEGYVLGAVSFELVIFEYVIDWIYVHPQVRRQGIGVGLIEEVLRAVMGIGERFPVTARFEFSEDDREMHTFFLSCQNMTTSYSHERYYVTAEDVKGSPALHRPTSADLTTKLFFELSEEEQRKILRRLSYEETYDVADYDRWKEVCVPELCRCVYVKNNLVDLIFMQKLPDGNLELAYLYGKYPRGLFELLSVTVKEMETLFPAASLTFEAMSQESELLAKHLFPKAKAVHIYEAEF
jgi:hypothetical protein